LTGLGSAAYRRQVDRPRRLVLWLHAQTVGLLLLYVLGHRRFQLQTGKDSVDYTDMLSLSPFSRAALSSRRTIGYPLFLKIVKVFSPDLSLLPLAQLAVHIATVYAFYRAVKSLRVDATGRVAVVLASCLIWADIVIAHPMFPFLMADSLGCDLAVLTVSCVLLTLGIARPLLTWPALTLALFFSYQVRPGYLCLLIAVPVLGFCVMHARGLWGEPVRHRWRWVGAWAAAGLAPFLLFSTIRLAVVGDFGLVSFGGTNVISIAGQLLTEAMVPELPEDLRPLASGLIETRQQQKCEHGEPWRSPAQGRHRIYLLPLAEQYICTCNAAQIVGERLYAGNVHMDAAFARLSAAVLKKTPLQYLDFYVKAFRWAVAQALTGLFMVVGGLFVVGYVAIRIRRRNPAFDDATIRALDLSLAIALPFFLVKMALVNSVEVPIDRYVDAAAVFLPMVPSALLLSLRPD
jgi:hypothetical protein